MNRISLVLMLCLGLLLQSAPANANPKNYEKARKEWVDSVMKTLTPRQQAAQLMVKACFPALGAEHVGKVAKFVEEDGIGGVTMSRGGPMSHAQTVNRLQSLSKVPLMIYMDAEWGVSMRLDSVVKFPRQMTLGAIVNDDLIYAMGEEVAMQCKRLGIHMNFAPVVDVNNNPNNPVIGSRSFGENKYNVAKKGIQYMKGMQNNGIMACAKHFPGHGDTDVDSHAALPLIPFDEDRLNDLELYPFKQLIAAGVDGMMIAHLNIPAYLKKDTIPSSMSPKVVDKLLRKKLKYKGLILTDGLEMKGVTNYFPANTIPLVAFKAGNDILLGVENPTGALDEFEAAINRGDVSKRKLKKAVQKVLEAKYDMGLAHYTPIDTTGIVADMNGSRAVKLRNTLAAAALTLVRNNDNTLPLSSDKLPAIAYLEVGKDEGKIFADSLSGYGSITKYSISSKPGVKEVDSVRTLLQPFGHILVGYHSTDVRPQYKYGTDSLCVSLIDELAANKKVSLDFFGLPYGLNKFKSIEAFNAVLVSYDNSPESQAQSAKLIMGTIMPMGKLPVTVNEKYKEGYGLE